MDWIDASDENPGLIVNYYDDPEHTGHRYVLQKKKDGTGAWRLAFRQNETEPLRIIFVAPTEEECKDYAQKFRNQLSV